MCTRKLQSTLPTWEIVSLYLLNNVLQLGTTSSIRSFQTAQWILRSTTKAPPGVCWIRLTARARCQQVQQTFIPLVALKSLVLNPVTRSVLCFTTPPCAPLTGGQLLWLCVSRQGRQPGWVGTFRVCFSLASRVLLRWPGRYFQLLLVFRRWKPSWEWKRGPSPCPVPRLCSRGSAWSSLVAAGTTRAAFPVCYSWWCWRSLSAVV